MELDFSPYNKVGSTFLILRMVALLVSTWFVTIQCSLLSVAPEFKVVTFCDAYLILDWYIKINMLVYVDGNGVTCRRLLFKNWVKLWIFLDILTLFPFEVSFRAIK